MKSSHFVAFAVWCNAALLWRGAGAQLDPAPACDMEAAQLCVDKARQSQEASGCNWYVLTPALSACVDSASAGCTEQQQLVWSKVVVAYNQTLQANDCYAPCVNQTVRIAEMQSCYDSFGSPEDIISQVTAQFNVIPQSPPSSCRAFATLSTCLVGATTGCPALIDLTYDRINAVAGVSAAYAACMLPQFMPATTSVPLALFDTATPADTLDGTVTTAPDDGIGQMVIIILGCIVIASTIAVVVTVIVLAVRKRRSHRQSILRDWRPNGQKVTYMDEAHLFPPSNQSPRQSGYRPQNYADLNGIINKAVH